MKVDTGVKVGEGRRNDVAELVKVGVTGWLRVGVGLWTTNAVALGARVASAVRVSVSAVVAVAAEELPGKLQALKNKIHVQRNVQILNLASIRIHQYPY